MREGKLSVVMTFKNEYDEVAKTCKSIRDTAGDKVDIIVLNDDSDKGFDYEESLKPYNVKYFYSPKRLGSSLGKQMCVDMCETPYFLILDAHCRMWTPDWYDKAIEIMEKNEDCVYCCCVRFFSDDTDVKSFGVPAYGAFYFYEKPRPLTCKWNVSKLSDTEFEIPCILGANYLCSKRWWNYIDGFNGLKLYGREEPFVSRKSLMLGGKVKCIPQIITGHKKRKDNKFPYHLDYSEVVHNELVMAYLLMNNDFDKFLKYYEKNLSHSLVQSALKVFETHKEEIESKYKHFSSLFKLTSKDIDDLNLEFCKKNGISTPLNEKNTLAATLA